MGSGRRDFHGCKNEGQTEPPTSRKPLLPISLLNIVRTHPSTEKPHFLDKEIQHDPIFRLAICPAHERRRFSQVGFPNVAAIGGGLVKYCAFWRESSQLHWR